MDNNELIHHGIRGQKWGVRRYQNADGSLTAAGKRKYGTKTNFEKVQAAKKAASPAALKAKRDQEKANARTAAEIAKYKKKAGLLEDETENKSDNKKTGLFKKKEDSSSKPRTMKDMSNEELQAVINRMNLEKNYLDAKRNLANATPQQVSKGQEFLKSIGKTFGPVLTRAAADVGEKWLKKKLGDKLGLNDVDEFEALAKQAKKAGYEKTIFEAEKARRELNKNKTSGTDTASNNSKSNTNSKTEKTTKKSKKEETKAAKEAFKDSSSEKKDEPLTGEVFGKGTSKTSEKFTNPNKFNFNDNDWVDATFRDLSPSSTDLVVVKQTGQNYINQFLLEDKHR